MTHLQMKTTKELLHLEGADMVSDSECRSHSSSSHMTYRVTISSPRIKWDYLQICPNLQWGSFPVSSLIVAEKIIKLKCI